MALIEVVHAVLVAPVAMRLLPNTSLASAAALALESLLVTAGAHLLVQAWSPPRSSNSSGSMSDITAAAARTAAAAAEQAAAEAKLGVTQEQAQAGWEVGACTETSAGLLQRVAGLLAPQVDCDEVLEQALTQINWSRKVAHILLY